MEELKELFGEGALTYAEFEDKLSQASNLKLANLKSGLYVDNAKYEKSNQNYKDLNAKYEALVEKTKDFEKDYAELQTLRTEKENASKLKQIADLKVDGNFSEFVLDQVNKLKSENDKFEDVLGKYVKEHPQYLTARQGVFFKGKTNVDLENGSKGEDRNTNQIMNDIFRNREN